jgi:pimeloyl-[acyl-carrier protein] methyl ester esterase
LSTGGLALVRREDRFITVATAEPWQRDQHQRQHRRHTTNVLHESPHRRHLAATIAWTMPNQPQTLVLLPGMDGSHHLFASLRAAAPAGVDLASVSFPPGDANGYQDLLSLVRAVLPGRPFYLLGWSFSGPLALLAASERPPGLRGVILAASFATRPVPYLPRWTRHLATPALFSLYPAWGQVKALLGGYGDAALRRLMKEAHARAGTRALARRAQAALEVDATAALQSCPVPVLYLRATEDRVIPASRAQAARRARPTLQIADIAGPHLALATNPQAAWNALTAFMDATDAAA